LWEILMGLMVRVDIQDAVRIFEEHFDRADLPPFGDDAPAFDFRGVDFFGNNYILYTPLDVSSRYADTFVHPVHWSL
jgi:hypothetical protein